MDKFNYIVLVFILFLYWLMKILGQIPYALNIRSVTITSSKFWYIYTIIVATLYLVVFFGTGLPLLQFQINGRILLGLNGRITKMHYFSKVFVAMAICVVHVMKTDSFITWSEKVRLLYVRVTKLRAGQTKYRRYIIFFVVRTIAQLTGHAISNVLRLTHLADPHAKYGSWVAVVFLTIPRFVITVCCNEFTVVTLCLADSLTKLNVNLRDQIKSFSFWKSSKMSRMQRLSVQVLASEKIEELNSLHSELYAAIQKMGELYSSRMFMVVAYLFLNIIAELYFTCDHVARRSQGLQPRPDVMEVFGAIHFCLLATELYFIINGGQLMKEASAETAYIVHRTSVLHLDERLKRTIEELSLRIRLTDIVIKPMRLFHLDSSSLYQMAHAMTTYLIILVQFKMTEEKERITSREFNWLS